MVQDALGTKGLYSESTLFVYWKEKGLKSSKGHIFCSSRVYMICQHFRFDVGKHCATVLSCPIPQGLIPQGDP